MRETREARFTLFTEQPDGRWRLTLVFADGETMEIAVSRADYLQILASSTREQRTEAGFRDPGYAA